VKVIPGSTQQCTGQTGGMRKIKSFGKIRHGNRIKLFLE